MEATRGAPVLQQVPCLLEGGLGADEGAVVQVPRGEVQPLDLPQLPEDGLEQEGEQERPEGVPLLDARLAAQGGVPEVQVGVLGVA